MESDIDDPLAKLEKSMAELKRLQVVIKTKHTALYNAEIKPVNEVLRLGEYCAQILRQQVCASPSPSPLPAQANGTVQDTPQPVQLPLPTPAANDTDEHTAEPLSAATTNGNGHSNGDGDKRKCKPGQRRKLLLMLRELGTPVPERDLVIALKWEPKDLSAAMASVLSGNLAMAQNGLLQLTDIGKDRVGWYDRNPGMVMFRPSARRA